MFPLKQKTISLLFLTKNPVRILARRISMCNIIAIFERIVLNLVHNEEEEQETK